MIESSVVKEQCRKCIDQLDRVLIFSPSKADHHYQDRDFGDQLYLSYE
jgi:hypothetical protein